MFLWSDDQIRFLRDASEYNRFNKTLAQRAAVHWPERARVCDAGCGLGYLSLALAPLCAHVTAADVSDAALSVLRKNLSALELRNVTVRPGNVFSLPAETRFDGMTFCFFGGTRETLRCIRRHCDGTAILFKKNWTMHRFDLSGRKLERLTYSATCAELDALNIPYESDSFLLEMGQPFRSLADAQTFFAMHTHDATSVRPGSDVVANLLVQTDAHDFPWYLPSSCSIGMIVINAANIPKSICAE